ncbi:RHS repeat protein [Photorhabdus heterorhabditis]|uniref:RHS repeat protein n=1 Tax=Photorhabdus heterorhabditis TaxID=880156 RepID=A0A5B0WLA7_9GAMM|nr:RHS repeat domain-containing protein [Photorhabdus heterorhabditis]KAA1187616.1 RHS repeat protein [Photorhabdus heterorhabditis]
MKNIDSKLYQHTPSVSVYDNRGLTIRNIDFHRTFAEGNTDTRITRHQYDAHGYLNYSIDPRLYDTNSGQPNFIWQYDLTGNLLRTESVDAGCTVTLNDIEGRLVLTKLATGVIQIRQYEDSSLPGRLLSITEQIPEKAPCVTERFIWAGNTPEEKNYNLAGQCARHYDTAGLNQLRGLSLTKNILSQSRQLLTDDQETDWVGDNETSWLAKLNNETYTTQSTFDATGTLLTQIDAKDNVQHLAYDIAGQLKNSWLTMKGRNEQIIIKSLTYSAAGQKLREEHGNGVITEYTYEPETQRLIGIKTHRPSDSQVLQDLRYEYDPVGNVISIRNDAEATRFWHNQKVVPENTYNYDSLYQLISATGREMANISQQKHQFPSPALPYDNNTYTNYLRTYTHDRSGNLTKIQHSSPATQNNYTTNLTISNNSNRAVLDSLTTDPAQVDALFDTGGHQKLLMPGQNLSWNARGELQQVTSVDHENISDREWYRYDSNGMRLLKVHEQQTGHIPQQQRVTYLPGLELRTTQNGNAITENLHVITVGTAGHAQVRVLHWETTPPADISNNQLRYSVDNLIGSSQLELDHKGQIISQEEYYPFGGTALWAAKNRTEANYKTIRYSGKERDATGLYYYGFRYYQPWIGRWLSADPAGTVDGLNLYQMVRNNPVTFIDTDGRMLEPTSSRTEAVQSPPSLVSLTRNAVAGFKHYNIEDIRQYLGGIRELRGSAYAHAHSAAEKFITNLENSRKKKAPDESELASKGYPQTLSQAAKVVGKTSDKYTPKFDENAQNPDRISLTKTPIGTGIPAKGTKNPLNPVLEFDAHGNEIFYRTMSEQHYEHLQQTGKLPPTTETSISPALSYSLDYKGHTVQFITKPGTFEQLKEIGIAANKPAEVQFPHMLKGIGEWMQTNARFKVEGGQMTTQLGQGMAIETFNRNIIGYKLVRSERKN